jgi:hypothetical protein
LKKRKVKVRNHALKGDVKRNSFDTYFKERGVTLATLCSTEELFKNLKCCGTDHIKAKLDIKGMKYNYRQCRLCLAIIDGPGQDDCTIPVTDTYCKTDMLNRHMLCLNKSLTDDLMFLCDRPRWKPRNDEGDVVAGVDALSCWDIMHNAHTNGIGLFTNDAEPFGFNPWPNAE